MAGGFQANTRRKFTRLPVLTKPSGGGLTSLELPKAGLLARLFLSIRIITAGTITTQNALGAASAIKRVRVTTNSGIDLYNGSGAGYHYLLQNYQELGGVNGRQPKNQGATALVTATTYNLDMVIPIAINMSDPVGMILLQSEQLQVIVSVEWEADSAVILTGGGTYTGTCEVSMEYYTVPTDKADLPPLNVVHQIIEDQIANAASSGDLIYNFPRGNTYLQALFGYGIKAAAVDNWTRMILRINQNDILEDINVAQIDQRVGYTNDQTRGLGIIPIDFLGSDGLGSYGGSRDFINSALLTDFQAVLTVSAADTLYVVRRMLMPLGG